MAKESTEPKFLAPETRGTDLSFGSFGLKAVTYNHITSNQIESARKVIARSVGKTGRVWIRVFPDRPWTQKAAEVPMGKGKGRSTRFCVEIRPGRIIFEVDGIPEAEARGLSEKQVQNFHSKGKL